MDSACRSARKGRHPFCGPGSSAAAIVLPPLLLRSSHNASPPHLQLLLSRAHSLCLLPLQTDHLTTSSASLPLPPPEAPTATNPTPSSPPTNGSSSSPFPASESETPRWNSILRTHLDSASFEASLSAFSAMRSRGARLDHLTLPLVNRAIGSSRLGQAVHALGIRLGFAADAFFCNTTIEAYARCGRVASARRLFDEMPQRDVVSWTSMIAAHGRAGTIRDSFTLFGRMRTEGVEPNPVTLIVVLQACCGVEGWGSPVAAQLFGFSIKIGFWNVEIVQNALLTAFVKTGFANEVEKIFDSIEQKSAVAWNVLISMHLSSGNIFDVIKSFDEMRRYKNPTHETLSMVLSAFARLEDLLRGQKMHSHALKAGLVDDVLCTLLVRLYCKCGELEKAIELFEESNKENCFTWSVMMSGYIQNGCFQEAVSLFRRMQSAVIDPDANVLREMIAACTQLSTLQLGKGIHGYLIRHECFGVPESGHLETSLMNMYAKCGSIQMARACFDHMVSKDIIGWSSMIEAYSVHGNASEALNLFHQMEAEGMKPNAITFLSVLSVCSHTGLVREACEVFFSLAGRHGLRPGLDHYTCIIDLLGRHGHVREAADLIQNMDLEPDSRIWGTLLASSVVHLNEEIGVCAAKKVFELEPENVGYHVLLSNLYARCGNWYEVENSRDCITRKKLRGTLSWSFVEVNREIHIFTAGDRSRHREVEICDILGTLGRQMEDIPQTNWKP